MIIKHKHGCSESLPHQDLPHNSNSLLEVFNFSHAYFFASIRGFYDFQKKNPATSIKQKPFSKLSQVAHIKMAILNKFYKTLTSHKALI
jgi:hypothetical protein